MKETTSLWAEFAAFVKRYPWSVPVVALSTLAGAALGVVAYYQQWLG